jgi:hypothetical protein
VSRRGSGSEGGSDPTGAEDVMRAFSTRFSKACRSTHADLHSASPLCHPLPRRRPNACENIGPRPRSRTSVAQCSLFRLRGRRVRTRCISLYVGGESPMLTQARAVLHLTPPHSLLSGPLAFIASACAHSLTRRPAFYSPAPPRLWGEAAARWLTSLAPILACLQVWCAWCADTIHVI